MNSFEFKNKLRGLMQTTALYSQRGVKNDKLATFVKERISEIPLYKGVEGKIFEQVKNYVYGYVSYFQIAVTTDDFAKTEEYLIKSEEILCEIETILTSI